MSHSFSLDDAVLTINGVELRGFENAQDAITVTPVGDDGDITYGIEGDGVFVHSCNKGATIAIKMLQHTQANKILNDLRTRQIDSPRTASASTISFKDLRNGDEFLLTGCWFTTPPTLGRGTAHNGKTWTLKAVRAKIKLEGGTKMKQELKIDEVTYELQRSNFFEANKQLKVLTALAKGCFAMKDGKTAFDIGELISNIGSEQFASVEKFILMHTTATDENGNKVLFSKTEELNAFFNEHRSHYYQVIFEGLKFHFLGFLPSGLESKINTLSLEEMAKQAM